MHKVGGGLRNQILSRVMVDVGLITLEKVSSAFYEVETYSC